MNFFAARAVEYPAYLSAALTVSLSAVSLNGLNKQSIAKNQARLDIDSLAYHRSTFVRLNLVPPRGFYFGNY